MDELYDPSLTDDERMDLLWGPLPPELPEPTMEIRIQLFRHASRRLNLLDRITVPVHNLADACATWIHWRDSKSLRPTDYEHIRLYEKGRPVGTLSWGGAIWSFNDPDLPFMDESRCLYDPKGINT